MHLNDVKLVVFDLDGVILDSEWAHETAKVRIYTELGVTERIDLSEFTGRSNRLFWNKILTDYNINGDVDSLVRRQFSIVMEELQRVKQMESPGLTQLLKRLKSLGICIAVSSGSEGYFIKDILNYLNVEEYFNCIVTGNDIVRLKPYPDIYLAALRLSGVGAKNAIAIEDSNSGCQAAQSAGLVCVGYTNRGQNPQSLSRADCKIDYLPELEKVIETRGCN